MTERPLAVDRRVRRTLLLVASCSLATIGWFLLDDSSDLNAQSPTNLVAQVNGLAITHEEVRASVAGELAALDRQRQELLQRAVDQRIDDVLIATAASKAGLEPAVWLARELGAADDPAYAARRRALHETLRRDAQVHVFPRLAELGSQPKL